MTNLSPNDRLKSKLQSIGALRPEAWEEILQFKKEVFLKPPESLIGHDGTLAYVADGLFKEYDAQNRTSPSIINFIASQESIITRKHNRSHYLKSCMPSLVYYWEFEGLKLLYADFPELKVIYDGLIERYDHNVGFRSMILEQHSLQQKILLFISEHRAILHLLKKKDMANYLNLDYDYFVRNYSKLL